MRQFVLPSVILFLCFSVLLALRLPRLGKRDFRTFVRVAPVWFCLFPFFLGIWEGLRLVIVALPGLFSYHPRPAFFFFFFFFFFFQITISSNEQAFMPIWQKTRSNSIEINIEDHDGTAYLKPTETKASSIF